MIWSSFFCNPPKCHPRLLSLVSLDENFEKEFFLLANNSSFFDTNNLDLYKKKNDIKIYDIDYKKSLNFKVGGENQKV